VSSGATQVYLDGATDPMQCRNDTCINKNHLLAEADWGNVTAGSTRSFNLSVTPKQAGPFIVRIRAWVTSGGYTSVWRDPTTGGVDQQNFWVYEYTVAVSAPTLSVTLSASPNGGPAPLSSTLQATSGGTATGTINYSFWWNCADPTASVSAAFAACGSLPAPGQGSCSGNANGYKCDGVSDTTKSVARTYSAAGNYTAKVIVERGAASPAEARTPVTVTPSASAGPAIGTGLGLLGNAHAHLDSWFNPRWPLNDEYLLRDATRRANNNVHGHNGQMGPDQVIETLTYGTLFDSTLSDADNAWTSVGQASGVDAQAYAAKTYDFLRTFGINSYDDSGGSMFSIVEATNFWCLLHPPSCVNEDNAHWDPARRRVYFGAITVSGYRPFSAAIDIVGHEWGHGVTDLHSGLEYAGESGALNEAFSDWVGVSLKRSQGQLVWTQGEDAVVSRTPFRDLQNPRNHGQPDTYGGDEWLPIEPPCTEANDYCWVHTNSGVPNKMFYLLAETGTHSHNGVSVAGLGLTTALSIAIDANTTGLWTTTTDFMGARLAMITAAAAYGPSAVNQVKNAWAAVGVGSPAAPIVTTGAASGVGQFGATLNGTVNPNGSTATTGFDYGTTTTYGTFVSAGTLNGSSAQGISVAVTLSCATTYHFRARGTSAGGTTYGSNSTFTTGACPVVPPSVMTNAPGGVGQHGATLHGTVNPNGATTTTAFEFGTTIAYGISVAAQTLTGSGAQGISASVTLLCGTQYHYRARATNTGGTSYGADVAFATSACPVTPPTVSTSAATAVGQYGAVLNGTVNPNHGSTTTAFDYGPTSSYGSMVPAQTWSGSSSQAISASVTLSCGTEYHFRARATNSAGTSLGSDAVFTTIACPVAVPTVVTGGATGIGPSTAMLSATVNPNGSSTTGHFQYGRTTAYGSSTSSQGMGAGNAPVPLTGSIAGLTCGTLYHYRAFATNAGGPAAGADATFTTAACPSRPSIADFDGDGTSDGAVFRAGAWLIHDTGTGLQKAGIWTGSTPGCIPVGMDYDGDGKTDFTQLCHGAWHFYDAAGNYVRGIWTGGVAGDRPVPADYDGDGRDDVVIFRRGAWLFFDNDTGGWLPHRSVWTGAPSWNNAPIVPTPMDYDGDGRADFAVYSGGPWHMFNRDGTYYRGVWTGGGPGDLPVPADYTGDGIDDVVIFRNGAWLFFDVSTGQWLPNESVWTGAPPHWHGAVSLPAPLDYDGDGDADFSVYSGGPWHLFNDDGTYRTGIWTGGVIGDQPISRRLLP
jgi:hypothetical protein